MRKLEVTWEVGDGYGGPSRPQHTQVDWDDILEDDMGPDAIDDVMDTVAAIVQDDFEQKISWGFTYEADLKAEVLEVLKAKQKERQ